MLDVGFEHITINGRVIGLDAKKGEINFISHAHTDHAIGFSKKIPAVSSIETIDIRKFNGTVVSQKQFEKEFNVKAKTLNAGHILGAKQLFIENGTSLLFTGDIKLHDNILVKGAEIINADYLILDCTYGKNEYIFPNPYEVYSQMERYIKTQNADTVVLMGYSIGKAQELVKFVNDYLDTVPITDANISNICRIFNKYGANLKFVETGTREAEELMQSSYVAVTTPNWTLKKTFKRASSLLNRKTIIIYTTGWALTQDLSSLCDKAFPLSDHCDFNELIQFVELVNPKQILCRWGFVNEFAHELKKRGYDAIPYSK